VFLYNLTSVFFLQERLDYDLVLGSIEIEEYQEKWEFILSVFNISEKQIEQFVDNNWTFNVKYNVIPVA
jgi:hypothetical protein